MRFLWVLFSCCCPTASVASFVTTAYAHKLPVVAFHALSNRLPNTEMARILAGKRAIQDVLDTADRIQYQEGHTAAQNFLNLAPSLYLWQTQQLGSMLARNPG